MAANAAAAGGGGQIILQQPGQAPVTLNNQQVVQILQQLQKDVDERNQEIANLKEENRQLKEWLEQTTQSQSAPAPETTTTTEASSTDTETIYV